MKPIQLCDKYAGNFQALNRKLRISNDFFVRTTQPKHYVYVRTFLSSRSCIYLSFTWCFLLHYRSAQELWKRCADAGDIYLDKYEGASSCCMHADSLIG